MIPLDEESRFPLYRQIYDYIKKEIQEGKMKKKLLTDGILL